MKRFLLWDGGATTRCSLEGTITGRMTVVASNFQDQTIVTRTDGHTVRTSRASQARYVPVKFTVWCAIKVESSRWEVREVCSWRGGKERS